MDRKKTVLVIDNDEIYLRLYTEVLSKAYNLETRGTASAALQYLNGATADIILLDVVLPNVSGFDFLSDLKRIPSYMEIPVIIISGLNDKEFKEKAAKSGAVDVLIKPVNPQVLINTIEKALAP